MGDSQGRSQEFATGDKRRGMRGGSPAAGSRGRAPVGFWGKPETNANFQLRRGDMQQCPPWLRYWYWQWKYVDF